MAEQHPTTQETNGEAGEVHDRGILDFLDKKEDENKPEKEMSVPEFAKEHVHKSEEKKEEEEHHPSADSIEQLPRSNGSSSSSDEEESKEGNKKKGKKDKIAGKHEEVETEEKKGLVETMKEKLAGGHKEKLAGGHKETDVEVVPVPVSVEPEKKGLVEKIKEKLPGHHQNEEEIEKEKEKTK